MSKMGVKVAFEGVQLRGRSLGCTSDGKHRLLPPGPRYVSVVRPNPLSPLEGLNKLCEQGREQRSRRSSIDAATQVWIGGESLELDLTKNRCPRIRRAVYDGPWCGRIVPLARSMTRRPGAEYSPSNCRDMVICVVYDPSSHECTEFRS